MKLQHVFQVVVCAALVALCVVSAGLFPAQSLVAQETSTATLRGSAAIEQLKQDDQYDVLQTAFDQARFGVSRAENTPLGCAAWHAPNPVAGYDAYITETGVNLTLNNESYLSLSLHSLGYGADLRSVSPGEVSGDKQMINIERDGGVREWYVNGPEGLEQGFTLSEPPGARQSGEPLRLALQVSEDWRAAASEDGQQVTLNNNAGQTVEYSKLVVRDQTERDIPSRLKVVDERVVIEVDDSESVYPLTIDPLFVFQQKLTADDGEEYDRFGSALAMSGDTAVIGANWDFAPNPYQGSVYVFVRNGSEWIQTQKLTASDGEATDNFGLSVAIEDGTILVGAEVDDVDGNENQGSVYVFTRNGNVWTEQQRLTAHDGAPYDNFGHAMAISGDTIAVGAFEDDIGGNLDQGSVYIFERNGQVWTEKQKLTGAYGDIFDGFGEDVALDGDTLVIGTPYDDSLAFNHGSVYVYARTISGWAHQQYLAASTQVNQFFGSAVAIDGDTIVVGAHGDNIGTNDAQGSVYIYTRSGTDWMYQQKLTASDGAAYDHFGTAVSLSGEILVIGADYDDVDTNMDQGSAYVFKGSGATWVEDQKLTAYDGEAHDYFAGAVAISGDTVMITHDSDDIGENDYQGSVYVFSHPSCPTLTFTPANLASGLSGNPYQQQVTVSGGTGPYQFNLVSGSLPPGISLSSSGLLSGTPTVGGSHQFTLSATDLSSICSSSRVYTITISSCPTLVLNPSPLPDGTTEVPYSQMLTASGGVAPYTFAVIGDLPPGVSLTASGLLSGTPPDNSDGDYEFRLVITDANVCATTLESRMTIIKAGNPPRDCPIVTIAPISLPSGLIGVPYSQWLIASGGQAPYQFVYGGGELPAGMSLSPSGLISGIPKAPGTTQVTFHAFDSRGCFGSRLYNLTITCPTIVLNPPTALGGVMGLPFSKTLTASGGTGPYTFIAQSGLPPGLSLSTFGVLSGVPMLDGEFNIRLLIRDAKGCSNGAEISMTIEKSGLEFPPTHIKSASR